MHDRRETATSFHIARKLPLVFNAARLAADLREIPDDWWDVHEGPYHNGRWDTVSLWAPGGNRREQRSAGSPFGPTEALARCPYYAEVLSAFACEKNRVRLMRLRAGGHIELHSDPVHQIADDLIRVHVPVQTSPEVKLIVNETSVRMQVGEVWHVDVRFPHEVRNDGSTDRVHLVIDLIANAAVLDLLERGESAGTGRLTWYYVAHGLPRN